MTVKARRSITIDPRLLKRLERQAKREGVSTSALIEQLCWRGLPDQELMAEAKRELMTPEFIEQLLHPDAIARAARLVAETTDQPDLFRQRAEAVARMLEQHQKRKVTR